MTATAGRKVSRDVRSVHRHTTSPSIACGGNELRDDVPVLIAESYDLVALEVFVSAYPRLSPPYLASVVVPSR